MTILTLQPEILFIIIGLLSVLSAGYIDHLTEQSRDKKQVKIYKVLTSIVLLLAFCCLIVIMFLLASNK